MKRTQEIIKETETVEHQFDKVIKIIRRELEKNYPKEEFDDFDVSMVIDRYIYSCKIEDKEPTVDIERITNFMDNDKYCKGIIKCWESRTNKKWRKDKIKINKKQYK